MFTNTINNRICCDYLILLLLILAGFLRIVAPFATGFTTTVATTSPPSVVVVHRRQQRQRGVVVNFNNGYYDCYSFTRNSNCCQSQIRRQTTATSSASGDDYYSIKDETVAESVTAAAADTDDYEIILDESNNHKNEKNNPMWPDGVSAEDVDELVEEILSDSSINLPQLPDFLERQIYRTTTTLTLNAAYRLVGWVHEKSIWGHSFQLTRVRCQDDDYANKARQKSLVHMKTDVDEVLLEQVADQLLDNAAINQPLVPDVVERQLYVNCLKIIFRILNMLAASFRITLCGHDLTLNLEKSIDRRFHNKNWRREVARKANSSRTPINTGILNEIVRTGIIENNNNNGGGEKGAGDGNGGGGGAIWERGQREFVIQVNTVLYNLILGILDDLLSNTELELMTDKIQFDIVAPPIDDDDSLTTELVRAERKKKKKKEQPPIIKEKKIGITLKRRQRVVMFLLGTAVGIVTGRLL